MSRVLQLTSSTEMGIKTQRYKPRHAEPAGTDTHTDVKTHSKRIAQFEMETLTHEKEKVIAMHSV